MKKCHKTLTPRRVADVQFPDPTEAIILVDEESPKVVRTRPRDGLHRGNSILDKGGGIFPEKEHGSHLRKLRMARHWKVFIIVK